MLQTPAFLCRQTDFIRAVAQSGKPVNIKKGQFLAPGDMKNVIQKARDAAREKGLPEDNFLACERGASFGYNNLVSDMRSLAIMRETGAPVVFDATHSVQLPGGQGTSSGGQREFVPVLARAAIAVGVAGVFMETHPDPKNALSDGPNAVPLQRMKALLETLVELDRVTKKNGFLEKHFDSMSRPTSSPTSASPIRRSTSNTRSSRHSRCRRTAPKSACAAAKSSVLEGDWQPERMIVLKFPSVAKARAFYDSPEYAKARDARAGAAIMRMIVVEGT